MGRLYREMGGLKRISIREIFSGKIYGGEFQNALETMAPVLAGYSHELARGRPATISCDAPEIQSALEFLWSGCGISAKYASGAHKSRALLSALSGLVASAAPLCAFYGIFSKPSSDMLERFYASFSQRSKEIRMMAARWISIKGTHPPDMSYVCEYALMLLLVNMFCVPKFMHCASLGKGDCICEEFEAGCAVGGFTIPAKLNIGVLRGEYAGFSSGLKGMDANTLPQILEKHGGTIISPIAMRLCPLLFSETPHPFLHRIYREAAVRGKVAAPQELARHILFKREQGAALMFSRRTCGLLKDELRSAVLSAAGEYACLGAMEERRECDSDLTALLGEEFGAWEGDGNLSPLDAAFELNESNMGKLCSIKNSLIRKRFAVRQKKYRMLILPL